MIRRLTCQIADRIASPRGWFCLLLITLALTWPALQVGWSADDYFHQFAILRPAGFEALFTHGPLLDLFRFFSPDTNRAGIDLGLLPWWSVTDGRGAFLRPVTAMTHIVDYALWPRHAALMHAHSLAWYVALVLGVARLYRMLEAAPAVAAIAALLYAIDDAHATPAAWLANRNAVVAAVFGVLAIIAYVRSRRGGGWRFSVLSALMLAVALLAGESGIAALAYIAAYALCVDGGSRRIRAASLLPHILVVIVWRIVWSLAGYGVDGIGVYVDPLADPIRFVGEAAWRVPCLLAGLTAFPPADIYTVAGLFLPLAAMIGVVVVAAAIAAAALALLWRAVREDAVGRFYFVAMLLSIPPICAMVPSDRLLNFAGIGAFGCIARIVAAWSRPRDRDANAGAWRTNASRTARTGVIVLVICHLLIAPVAMLVRSTMPVGPRSLLESIQLHLPADADLAGKTVIVVNPPVALPIGYLTIRRAADGLSTPAHLRVLGPSLHNVTCERIDERTLLIRPDGGYLLEPMDTLCRGPNHPLRAGDVIELSDMTIEITDETPDGRPAAARFRFNVPLEDPSLLWVAWRDGQFEPFTPPAIGERLVLRGLLD